jgi:hypothetical protein
MHCSLLHNSFVLISMCAKDGRYLVLLFNAEDVAHVRLVFSIPITLLSLQKGGGCSSAAPSARKQVGPVITAVLLHKAVCRLWFLLSHWCSLTAQSEGVAALLLVSGDHVEYLLQLLLAHIAVVRALFTQQTHGDCPSHTQVVKGLLQHSRTGDWKLPGGFPCRHSMLCCIVS